MRERCELKIFLKIFKLINHEKIKKYFSHFPENVVYPAKHTLSDL